MRNLEQIRAKNALEAASSIKPGPGEGDPQAVAKKVPTMIRENGILATAAFAKEGKVGIQSVLEAVKTHLKRLGIMPVNESGLLEWLTSRNSSKLRAVTAETMAYLSYLRRFAGKTGE